MTPQAPRPEGPWFDEWPRDEAASRRLADAAAYAAPGPDCGVGVNSRGVAYAQVSRPQIFWKNPTPNNRLPMTPYDGEPLRKGDVILIQAEVVNPEPDGDGDILVTYSSGRSSFVSIAAIHSIAQRAPIQAGDRVRCSFGNHRMTVIALHGPHAWCQFSDGSCVTYATEDLARAT